MRHWEEDWRRVGCYVKTHPAGAPDKPDNQDLGFCIYNRVMYHSDSGRRPVPETWQQQVQRAASYAASALDHPLYRFHARESGISAHSLAFLDCIGAPRLAAVDSSHWTGGIGESIHFHVKNNVRVMRVRIMVRENKTSREALESGQAHPSRLNPSIWTYITQTEILQAPGLCMDVIASDLAGNIGTEIVVFDYE
jgi:hypothetical protein